MNLSPYLIGALVALAVIVMAYVLRRMWAPQAQAIGQMAEDDALKAMMAGLKHITDTSGEDAEIAAAQASKAHKAAMLQTAAAAINAALPKP